MADLLLFDPAFFDPAFFDTTGAQSSEVGDALIAKLRADLTLSQLMPDGVWKSVAPPKATRFVIVSQIISEDVLEFQRRAYEDKLFLVEARARSTSDGNVYDAAARIDTLLDPQPPLPPPTLDVPGYELMGMGREEAIETTEFDETNPDIRWLRAGGHYRVQVSLE